MCPDGTLTVGVTSDEMLKSKANAHMVTSLPERLEGVREFVRCFNIRFCFVVRLLGPRGNGFWREPGSSGRKLAFKCDAHSRLIDIFLLHGCS